uniref:acetolactate synthase small subunit n=1 Tax=Microzonia abyssicola TaxID=217214 RepID=UPI002E79925B|nr:acetolactate synthase small subunit [Syringoderma abyssicola]WAM65030.1 acetolactate synthase small subunit [Syringoderma abyssicola]
MKRTLAIKFEKEAGGLVRIIGLITRRRFKIASITVGECENSRFDRMIIVVINEMDGGDSAAQLTSQLRKLVNIVNVTDMTYIPAVQRELLLIKLRANKQERAEILDLIQIFRFKIVDLSEHILILEIVGDPGKIAAIEEILTNYEIIELVRTGKIGLIRESAISTYNATKYPFFSSSTVFNREEANKLRFNEYNLNPYDPFDREEEEFKLANSENSKSYEIYDESFGFLSVDNNDNQPPGFS